MKPKPFRTTAIVSVFVLALAAYTAWDYKKSLTQGDEDTPQEKKLFNLKREDISQIKLTRGTDVTWLEHSGDTWKLKQPVEDLAEASSVDSFLFSILSQKGKVFRSEDESKGTKWAEFGLEPPGLTVELSAGAKTESIAVASKNAYDGSFYVRRGDELLLGDRAMAQASARDANSFRSRRLWREGDAAAVAADVKLDGDIKDSFKFKKADGKWTMEPAPAFAVDAEKIEQWIKHLTELTPSEIAAEGLTEENKRQFLLLKPSLIATLHLDKTDWTVTAGQDKAEDVYIYTSQRPTLYKTSHAALDLVRVPKEYFRDGGKGFKFPLEAAREVQIHADQFNHTFSKDGTVWKLSDNSGDTFDADKLPAFFQNLSHLESQEFLPPGSGKGFKPEHHVLILGEAGKKLLDLSWGDEYKAKRAYNKGITFRFVKTGLEKEVLAVNSNKINALIDTSMVKKKTEPGKGPPGHPPIPGAKKAEPK